MVYILTCRVYTTMPLVCLIKYLPATGDIVNPLPLTFPGAPVVVMVEIVIIKILS